MFLCLLQPVPTASSKAELEDHGSKRAHPYGGAAAGRGKSRGGKGKGKGSDNVKLPQGLEGCRSLTNRGEPICFTHNLGPVQIQCLTEDGSGHMCGAEVWGSLPWSKHVPQKKGRND